MISDEIRNGPDVMKSASLEVTMTIPEHYAAFWEKLRSFYKLPDEALDQVVSEQFIQYINLMHEELGAQPVIGLCPSDIKKSLEL